MPFCIRCSPYSCGDLEGIISVNLSMNSSVRPAIYDPACGGGSGAVEEKYIPGSATGVFSITAYAFKRGEDPWGDIRCRGQAQASQSNIVKYDLLTKQNWVIPSRVHRAEIAGDVGAFCSLDLVLFEGSRVDSTLVNGVTITSEIGVQIGGQLSYYGNPLNIKIPTLTPFTLLGDKTEHAYINSFSFSVDYPNQPPTVSYSFEFPLAALDVDEQ